jgi:hypothetical protein
LSFGSNVIIVGYGEDLENAASVVKSINDRTVILETDKELKYAFTDIPNDRIGEFTAILESLRLDVSFSHLLPALFWLEPKRSRQRR